MNITGPSRKSTLLLALGILLCLNLSTVHTCYTETVTLVSTWQVTTHSLETGYDDSTFAVGFGFVELDASEDVLQTFDEGDAFFSNI